MRDQPLSPSSRRTARASKERYLAAPGELAWHNRESDRAPLRHSTSGPLQPNELAQAAVMGALCSVTAIIAAVIPFAQGLGVLGTVPMGLLAYRFRPRVLIASAVAATIIAF